MESDRESVKKVTRSHNKEAIQEMKDRMKREKLLEQMCSLKIVDYYDKAQLCIGESRKPTGIVYDDSMALHKCDWDVNYPENPDRYRAVLDRCKELGLVDRCLFINFTKATRSDVTRNHKDPVFDNLESICAINDVVRSEKIASKYDAIYFNEATFNAARVAAGCVLSLVRAVCSGEVQNGMAIVRPPGHHAMANEYCGYCYFNNVAIAAQNMLDNKLAKKILIVDFDVHHGQATQQMFYNDNRVLYFSIHRYENGTFWPNLRESNFDYIGAGAGIGYNINVPLNVTNLGDKDYLSIVFHILLPVAYEFDPNIVIFSAGYDSCIGCPEGQMVVTPGFYGHLISLLGGLANGKQAVCLEGGYYLPSLAEGAAMSLRALLDDSPARLLPSAAPEPEVIDVINNLKFILRHYWNCFNVYNTYVYNMADSNAEVHDVHIKYLGQPEKPPYLTRDCYPTVSMEDRLRHDAIILQLQEEYSKIKNGKVCYSYDSEMLDHVSTINHPENPNRLKKVYELFTQSKLNERCVHVPPQAVDPDLLKTVHCRDYVDCLLDGTYVPTHSDIYYDAKSINSIVKSIGCLLGVVDSVMKGESRSGAALIRPPGHHATHSDAEGFCFVANVAVAAKHILNNYAAKRVMIVDFDIHHGNGTQQAFYSEDRVLYVSIHKYNNASFFPYSNYANYNKVGEGAGAGFNVNIPFNKDKMGDSEYLAVFHRIILPLAYSYDPDAVIVSAGFDAGVYDTIGNYSVTPEAFGHLIQMLKSLARGCIILALEGGYNLTTLSYSMNMCIKALLGDPLPRLNPLAKVKTSALETIETVMKTHKQFWPILGTDRKLPDKISSITVGNEHDVVIINGPNEITIQKIVDYDVAKTIQDLHERK